MAYALPMKHILRFVLLVASVTIWAVVFTLINGAFLNLDEALLIGLALMVGLAQTVALAMLLRF